MNAKQIRKMILAILARADYDLAKSLDPKLSDDPQEARRTMSEMVQIANEHLAADRVKIEEWWGVDPMGHCRCCRTTRAEARALARRYRLEGTEARVVHVTRYRRRT